MADIELLEIDGGQSNKLNVVCLSSLSGAEFTANFPTRFVGEEYFVRFGPTDTGDFSGVTITMTYVNGSHDTPYPDLSGNDLTITEPCYHLIRAASDVSTLTVVGLTGGVDFAWKLIRK